MGVLGGCPGDGVSSQCGGLLPFEAAVRLVPGGRAEGME